MKKFALCLHDLRLSEGEGIIHTIEAFLEKFYPSPLTVHLVVDRDPVEAEAIMKYLQKKTTQENLEIVFHGITHTCRTGSWLSWYHNNQAEFLDTTFDEKGNGRRFRQLRQILGVPAGFCPPCWLARAAGWNFIKSLSPLYIESLLWIRKEDRKIFSPVISLGSIKKSDLVLLKALARIILLLSLRLKRNNIRLVIHTADIKENGSMDFMHSIFHKLIQHKYVACLQKHLLPE